MSVTGARSGCTRSCCVYCTPDDALVEDAQHWNQPFRMTTCAADDGPFGSKVVQVQPDAARVLAHEGTFGQGTVDALDGVAVQSDFSGYTNGFVSDKRKHI
eukprot:5445890-Pleurochrysis_carterae.AAC.1